MAAGSPIAAGPAAKCRSIACSSWVRFMAIRVYGRRERGSKGARERPQGSDRGGQAAEKEPCEWRDSRRPAAETGWRRKEFLPEGMIARGMGAWPRRPLKFFDSSQAPRRGSQISVWPSQKHGLQAALDEQVVQMQFDDRTVLGEVAADVDRDHFDSGEGAALALCFNDHSHHPGENAENRPRRRPAVASLGTGAAGRSSRGKEYA